MIGKFSELWRPFVGHLDEVVAHPDSMFSHWRLGLRLGLDLNTPGRPCVSLLTSLVSPTGRPGHHIPRQPNPKQCIWPWDGFRLCSILRGQNVLGHHHRCRNNTFESKLVSCWSNTEQSTPPRIGWLLMKENYSSLLKFFLTKSPGVLKSTPVILLKLRTFDTLILLVH